MVGTNASWYLNNDPESGLNPLLKFVNSNSNEENRAIISWANENGIELIGLKKYTAVELIQKRHEYRQLLEKVLAGTNLEGDDCCLHEYRQLLEKVLAGTNLEGDDCCLRGFGTLEEHRIFHEICKDQTHGYHKFNVEKNAYWEAVRLAEYKELGFNPDLSRRYVVERILKSSSNSQLE